MICVLPSGLADELEGDISEEKRGDNTWPLQSFSRPAFFGYLEGMSYCNVDNKLQSNIRHIIIGAREVLAFDPCSFVQAVRDAAWPSIATLTNVAAVRKAAVALSPVGFKELIRMSTAAGRPFIVYHITQSPGTASYIPAPFIIVERCINHCKVHGVRYAVAPKHGKRGHAALVSCIDYFVTFLAGSAVPSEKDGDVYKQAKAISEMMTAGQA